MYIARRRLEILFKWNSFSIFYRDHTLHTLISGGTVGMVSYEVHFVYAEVLIVRPAYPL
jgi:hypothetical protein